MSVPHSYEEIREVVIEILLGKENVEYEPSQFSALVSGVAEVFARRDGTAGGSVYGSIGTRPNPHDSELVRDVFWDLFRQGYITLGLDNANANWPFFRLSHFGSRTLGSQSPNRFHDTASFIAIIKKEVPDISNDAVVYLEEAVAAFYADCLLSACVMLGVAAESEFLRLLDIAGASTQHPNTFAAAAKDGFIRTRITKFQAALKPIQSQLTPKKDFEDLDTNLSLIQSVLRIARNEAGHPTGAMPPNREQVYTYLQLFVPFARQLMKLRIALA
ncbi:MULTISPECIES: hypothetical protein [Rhizobium/Agrobacterium group]|uniref:hypothetical protein n=1 Tax=Rhizobium/Agrobacterium group TaxID=227290 RepID=UPI0008DC175B|nr:MULTISPECIES: hypothetical protein [Rhizobium/Agrobacterium group]MCF1436860.1 hypothetical protein [Allorhizobium ampelinum]MCF1464417.1 hypothetical protein [Allorhizobium ampelinum]MCF1495357.1 hypothetical protein [Allorhizobium ampelinum]MUO92386.1 hypothetical protein [Agrobacterium vitis]MUZ54222.1 hypothetical protein [Agrobacterium vitis]